MRIAKEALPFAAASLSLAVAAWWLFGPWVALLPLLLFAFVLWFFRDPERETPGGPDLLIAPADGKIIEAGPELISVFMDVFNVHVTRAPAGGTVRAVEHRPGKFMAAFKDRASTENERTSIELVDGSRRILFTLVAGLIARRIVCKVGPGQRLSAGQRVGLIRFGSRVDVSLPTGAEVLVRPGQKVLAGETIIASIPADRAEPQP